MKSISKTTDVTKFQVHQLDSKFSRKFTNTSQKQIGGGARGTIRELSRQSRTRLIYKARNTAGLQTMYTFTYPHSDYASSARGGDFMRDGLVVKEHLRRVRQWFTSRGATGFWFFEFQKRGAPHFHFMLTSKFDQEDQDKIARNWARLVGSDCPHHLDRGTDYQELRSLEAAGAYAAKYSSKDEQKTVPSRYKNVGRFWGMFGCEKQTKVTVATPLREVYRLMRIARKAQQAYSRDRGFRYKARDRGQGYAGLTMYNTGRALRYYILRNWGLDERGYDEIEVRTDLEKRFDKTCTGKRH